METFLIFKIRATICMPLLVKYPNYFGLILETFVPFIFVSFLFTIARKWNLQRKINFHNHCLKGLTGIRIFSNLNISKEISVNLHLVDLISYRLFPAVQ